MLLDSIVALLTRQFSSSDRELNILHNVYGHVHSSLRILVNISGPIKRHGVVDFFII